MADNDIILQSFQTSVQAADTARLEALNASEISTAAQAARTTAAADALNAVNAAMNAVTGNNLVLQPAAADGGPDNLQTLRKKRIGKKDSYITRICGYYFTALSFSMSIHFLVDKEIKCQYLYVFIASLSITAVGGFSIFMKTFHEYWILEKDFRDNDTNHKPSSDWTHIWVLILRLVFSTILMGGFFILLLIAFIKFDCSHSPSPSPAAIPIGRKMMMFVAA